MYDMIAKIDVGWIDPGTVDGKFAHSIASSIADMEYFECLGTIHRRRTSIPVRTRNRIVEDFLEGGSEWLWMVDSDMVFDKGHVMKLWNTAQDTGADMVTGLGFIFRDQTQPVPSFFTDGIDGLTMAESVIPPEAIEIAATGLFSSLIHRRVFEGMPASHESYRWFGLPTDPDQVVGDDVNFYLHARKAGFHLFLEPDAETWHLKTIGIGRAEFDRYWELRNMQT